MPTWPECSRRTRLSADAALVPARTRPEEFAYLRGHLRGFILGVLLGAAAGGGSAIFVDLMRGMPWW